MYILSLGELPITSAIGFRIQLMNILRACVQIVMLTNHTIHSFMDTYRLAVVLNNASSFYFFSKNKQVIFLKYLQLFSVVKL